MRGRDGRILLALRPGAGGVQRPVLRRRGHASSARGCEWGVRIDLRRRSSPSAVRSRRRRDRALYVFAWRLTRSSSAAARSSRSSLESGPRSGPIASSVQRAAGGVVHDLGGVLRVARGPRGRLRDAVFAGAFVGLALLTRHELTLLLLPILLLHATTPDASVRLPRAIATLAGVTPALLLSLAYNAMRFGNPFDTGTCASDVSLWQLGVDRALRLALFPGSVTLRLLSAGACRCRGTRVAVAAGPSNRRAPSPAPSILVVLFYAQLGNWIAGRSYGPRYLVPIVPLLLLPLAWRFVPGDGSAAGWRRSVCSAPSSRCPVCWWTTPK